MPATADANQKVAGYAWFAFPASKDPGVSEETHAQPTIRIMRRKKDANMN
ncbi:MAG: hypothetical protein H7839_23675 [Magnetococcus sp. YQC-5]